MIIGVDAARANLKKRTGTEWYSYYLIDEFKRIGQGHTFILYTTQELLPDLAALPDNFQSRVLTWSPRFLWTQIRLAWEVMVHPPDILFVPAHTLPICARTKMVVTIHDVGFRVYPELYSTQDILYHRFSVWYASRFAYRIICPSEFTKQELIKYYGTNASKIVVIAHGAEKPDATSESFPSLLRPPGRVEEREGRGRNSDSKVYLLFIGRLEQKKNILGILHAFRQLLAHYPDLKLKLAGAAGYGFEQILQCIAEYNLHRSVELLGYVDAERRATLYRQAQAFVFPTLYEGFGMPILEAQSYGCPVVTSNFGATAEVAGDSAVLVDPRQPDAIAAGLERILSDLAYRQEFVTKGFENAKKYSWEQCARETLRVLMD